MKPEEKARSLINSFRKFIEENKDELTALQILYSKSYGQRHLTYEQIKQLADAVKKPPYHLTPALLWKAYEQLERSKVRGAGAQKLLTNMVSLVRFALGQNDVLEPFPEIVERRFLAWLNMQKASGAVFTPEQIEWFSMMKEHIAASIFEEDLDATPFHDKGGRIKAHHLFGGNLNKVLDELNEALAA